MSGSADYSIVDFLQLLAAINCIRKSFRQVVSGAKLVRWLPSGVESVERYIQIPPVNFRIFQSELASRAASAPHRDAMRACCRRAPGASLPAASAVVYEKVAGWIAIAA
jgi:hypothetical protein